MNVTLRWQHLWWVAIALALFLNAPDVARGEWHLSHLQQIATLGIVIWWAVERAVRA